MSILRIGALSALALATVAACAPASAPSTPPRPLARTADPRVGLKAGVFDAGEAISNLRLVSATPPPAAFLGKTNTDLAFIGNYVFQGSYHGFQIWDISTPARPTLVKAFECPASQSDVSV
jgi:hypothetical protein